MKMNGRSIDCIYSLVILSDINVNVIINLQSYLERCPQIQLSVSVVNKTEKNTQKTQDISRKSLI